MKAWYVSSTGNEQGLVVEEGTGKNIAVTYERKHAQLIAAAPAMLYALKRALAVISQHHPEGAECCKRDIETINEAIEEAGGR